MTAHGPRIRYHTQRVDCAVYITYPMTQLEMLKPKRNHTPCWFAYVSPGSMSSDRSSGVDGDDDTMSSNAGMGGAINV